MSQSYTDSEMKNITKRKKDPEYPNFNISSMKINMGNRTKGFFFFRFQGAKVSLLER